jgi:hypothetical protein
VAVAQTKGKNMRWLVYWTLGLAATVGVVLNVLEEQGHTLGGVILAGVGMFALFGFIGMFAQVITEDFDK